MMKQLVHTKLAVSGLLSVFCLFGCSAVDQAETPDNTPTKSESEKAKRMFEMHAGWKIPPGATDIQGRYVADGTGRREIYLRFSCDDSELQFFIDKSSYIAGFYPIDDDAAVSQSFVFPLVTNAIEGEAWWSPKALTSIGCWNSNWTSSGFSVSLNSIVGKEVMNDKQVVYAVLKID